MSTPPPSPGQPVLEQVLAMLQPLVVWLLRSGVVYTDLTAALKPVFLEAARAELTRIGGKQTDSALSLLSGVHRKDVRAAARTERAVDVRAQLGKPTPASQVMTRWLASDLPDALPFSGAEASFEALARAVSKDIHPRSVLLELLRLGVVEEHDGGEQVRLCRQAFVPNPSLEEARRLLAGSVADHIEAGVHNLSAADGKTFLEQSVFADGLSAESARQLEQLANSLWRDVLAAMVKAAVPLCEQDEPAGGDQRIRLGMFCLTAPMAPTSLASDTTDNTSSDGDTTHAENKP
ncbi:DUF6502 family protein [Rhodoferax sp.]|uniref:DUF6502 family protein n=1 Tax=Rhodoferax sp. TaxID=50421 RepID=UPI00374DCB5A